MAKGATAVLYKGGLYPLDTKDLEKAHEARIKGKQEGSSAQGAWREFSIPGTSGSGQPQPEDGGVLNPEPTKQEKSKTEKK
jgi:hypothetical protein